MQFEIPVLETDDAVTELQPKRSFNNLKLKTSDANLYAAEKIFYFQFEIINIILTYYKKNDFDLTYMHY